MSYDIKNDSEKLVTKKMYDSTSMDPETHERHVQERKKELKKDSDDKGFKADLKELGDIKAEPMIKAILQARKGLVSNEEYETYENSLREKSFSEIKEIFEDQKPLFSDPCRL